MNDEPMHLLRRRSVSLWMVLGLVALGWAGPSGGAEALRRVIPLDGAWQIAEGSLTNVPAAFTRTAPVPGLVDMARPAFEEVGVPSNRREAFWYKRSFRLRQPIPAVAQLKLHKAMFGSRVILNGQDLGEHPASFTPGYFDVRAALRQGENEILIRVGAYPTADKKSIGWDYEKKRYIPGVFDAVELILTGAPHLDRVQAVPDLERQAVTVHTWPAGPVQVTVREARSGRVVGAAQGVGPLTIPLAGCRLWTPEDPFLYELTARTPGDELSTRFGMRTFRLDPQTGRAILNGKPYFMRGSNVTLYRFFEDAERANLPWDEAWVRKLHRRFKDMHWNSLRYCIGFPPEFWYRLADEEGFLIQDEFPVWAALCKPGDLPAQTLAGEYRDWMQERWNHPCVVIWDACNETALPETGAALAQVRELDYSHRPWDNGWFKPARDTDVRELHPYHFIEPDNTLELLTRDPGTLGWVPGQNPIIVNEYGWLWLNRDGTPTRLTRQLYEKLLGPQATTAQRRLTYARLLAAETEFWRARRACAAVLHFCGLGYSRPDPDRLKCGQTSDHWLNVARLKWEPLFYRYVRDAFAPVGVMIDDFTPTYRVSQARAFPLVVINDLDQAWSGQMRVRLWREERVVAETRLAVAVPALGQTQLLYQAVLPAQPGACRLQATLLKTPAGEVSSLRDFTLLTAQQLAARNGLAVGKPATASSVMKRASGGRIITYGPGDAVDGSLVFYWGSDPHRTDPQWLAVDLQTLTPVGGVELCWGNGFAKSYAIQVSMDGSHWTEVYTTKAGKGGTETLSFTPVTVRWVRFQSAQRAGKSGFQIRELRVFPPGRVGTTKLP